MADSAILRTGSEALMPEDAAREIIQGAAEESAVLQLGRRLPNMTRQQRRLPVLSALPLAYFVNAGEDPSDTRFKRVTELAWANKFIDAEEIAVIVPIPENVIEDADYDIWAEAAPRIREAIGVAIDAAVFHGVGAPNIWPEPLVDSAEAAGNVVALGTGDDLYDDLMAEGGLIAQVEEDGYFVNGHVAAMQMRARLRGLRGSTNDHPIFSSNMQGSTPYALDGSPLIFPRNGALDTSEVMQIAGDWNQLVYAIRKDITTKLLTEAIIQDPADGSIVYNLAQQDMVALRVVMRLGWQVPNPINRLAPTEGGKGVGYEGADVEGRYPFAVLTPGGS